MPAASFTIAAYLSSLIPNIATAIPGYTPDAAINGAMALYWTYLFPDQNPVTLDETTLSERQKYMIALRCAITLLPIINGWFSSPQVMKAGAGPAMVEFQDLSKVLRALLPSWQTDLTNLEAAEDIFFNLLPSIPAFLLKIEQSFPLRGETIGNFPVYVPQSGTTFFEPAHVNTAGPVYFEGEGVRGNNGGGYDE